MTERPPLVRLYEAALSYRTLSIGAYRTQGRRPSGLLLQQLAEADETLAQYEAWLAEQFAIDGGAA